MPLRLKCHECGRALLVEEVYQGAHCRCQYCRSLVSVPRLPRYAAQRPATRPERPPIAGRRPARPHRHAKPVARSRSALNRLVARVGAHRALSAAFVLAVTSLGVAVWTVTSTTGRAPRRVSAPPPLATAGVEEADPAERNARIAMLAADPLKTYFGIPLEGQTIGYVVDCDSSMAPYIDQVAFITEGLNAMIEPGTRRFGIVQAVSDPEGHQLTEVYAPSDLAGASTILQSRLAAGETDLPAAFAKTLSWYPDQMFVVLSKPLEAPEIALLRQHAEQTGAVTHVIALGAAAGQPALASIADATGGRLVAVSDAALNQLVTRYEERLAEVGL